MPIVEQWRGLESWSRVNSANAVPTNLHHVLQNDFSPFLRVFEGELAEACAPSHYNIGLLSYGVLLGGTLSGKYLNGYDHSKGRHALFQGECSCVEVEGRRRCLGCF